MKDFVVTKNSGGRLVGRKPVAGRTVRPILAQELVQ